MLVGRAELPTPAAWRCRCGRRCPAATPARAAAGQLLAEHRVVHVVAALAAQLLGVLQAEEADLGQLREHLVGKPARVLPLGGVGAQLVGHEPPHRLAQLRVLFGEGRDRLRRPGRRHALGELARGAHSVVCPRPAWSKPSRSPLGFFGPAVVVGAHLGDAPVAELEPLGAAVQPALAGLGVAPGHRPLDHHPLAVVDRVLDRPLAVDVLHRPVRVLADRARALVRAQARVVVGGVVGEVLGHAVGVA